MIFLPFTVRSRNVSYSIVDRDVLDSEETKRQVNRVHAQALATAQEGAKCKSRGLPDRQELDNRVLGVFEDGELLGIFMLGSLSYISGPWDNLQAWNAVSPGADVILEAVPLPGVFKMAPDVEEDFAASIFDVVVSTPRLGLMSGQGVPVGFGKLHYGIYLDHTDAVSRRVQGQHSKVKLHPRLKVTETLHPTIVGLTIAEVRAR